MPAIPAVPPTPIPTFALRGEHITLDALCKASGWADSGGSAKMLIAQGSVRVNGTVEVRRGRKLRAGDRVAWGDEHLLISVPPPP
jgi:ribosome-associated protein